MSLVCVSDSSDALFYREGRPLPPNLEKAAGWYDAMMIYRPQFSLSFLSVCRDTHGTHAMALWTFSLGFVVSFLVWFFLWPVQGSSTKECCWRLDDSFTLVAVFFYSNHVGVNELLFRTLIAVRAFLLIQLPRYTNSKHMQWNQSIITSQGVQ